MLSVKPTLPSMVLTWQMLAWCTTRRTRSHSARLDRQNEDRLLDIAMVEVMGVVLVRVYVESDQDVRAISLRLASKQERKHYANLQQD